jgi:hypothetical protein
MADLVTRLLLQTKNFDDGITRSAAEMKKMRERANSVKGEINSLSGIMGKFAGALGVAMTAQQAFKKTIDGCQASADSFAAIQQSATTSVDNFFSSMASGDFTSFINGIDNIASSARQAYNALDDLSNMSMAFSNKQSRVRVQMGEDIVKMRKGRQKGASASDKAAAAAAKKDYEKLMNETGADANKMYNQSFVAMKARLASRAGVRDPSIFTDQIIQNVLESDISSKSVSSVRRKIDAQWAKYLKGESSIINKYGGKSITMSTSAGSYSLNTKVSPKLAKVQAAYERKHAQLIAMHEALSIYTDKELQDMGQKYQQAWGYRGLQDEQAQKLLRYGNVGISGGTKHTGAHRTNVNTPPPIPLTEMEQLDAKLQKLETSTPTILDAEKLKSVYAEIDAIVKRMTDLQNSQSENSLNARFSLFNTYGIWNRANPTYNNGNASNRLIGSGGQSAAWDQLQGTAPNMDLIDKEVRGMSAPVDTTNQKLTDTYNTMSTIYNVSGQLAGSFSDLGAAFKELGADSKGFSAALAVAQFAMAISSAIGGMVDKANKSSLTVWDWIAGIAAGTAAVVTMAAQIKSIGAFANGGIVQGSSYSGDKLMVRANSGEMILNGGQQKNLFDLINNGGTAGGGRVEFMISGSNLKGVLNNYDHKTSKI